MSLIAVKQINPTELSLAVQQYASGAAFSGNFVQYVSDSGWLGPLVVYVTGAQNITGSKRFLDPLLVNYSGNTGSAPSTLFVLDKDLLLSGVLTGQLTTSSNTAIAAASGVLNAQIIYESGLAATGLSSLSGFTTAMSGALQAQIGAGGLGTGYSGYASNTFVDRSTDQLISGNKIFTFNNSGPGAAGTTSFVSDALFSGRAVVVNPPTGSDDAINLGYLLTVSGALTGAGSSSTKVTGSAAIAIPNFTGVGSVTLTYDGTYVHVSGAANVGTYSGYAEATFVHLTGAETISGVKTFATSPTVPTATLGTQAINLAQLSGTSGVLVAAQTITNNYWITGTGVVAVSSNASGNITNTFTITSGTTNVVNSGTSSNTFNGTTTLNINNPTGNFVNMSFWFDQYSLGTGLNTIESFVARDFTFTGYALGVINSGTQGFFSGSFYQRTSTNTKTNFVDFSLNSGQFFVAAGGYSQTVSGLNRVGLDIYRIGTGITGLSIGLFGVGY